MIPFIRFICSIFLVVSCYSAKIMAEPITLTFASWGPDKHYIAEARTSWVSQINEKFKGRLTIVEYPAGQLYGPKEMHIAVAKGLVDLGIILQPRMMALIPMLQGVYLPFAYDNVTHAAQAYQGESLEIIDKALAEKHLKLIYTSFTDGVQMFSAKKSLESINDFVDLRILSTSPMLTKILAGIGASPDTSIPQTEQYMALKRGVADASLNSTVSGYFQKSFEVSPYVTKINMSYPTIMVAMNLDKWQKLPVDIQEFMLSTGQQQSEKSIKSAIAWESKFTSVLKRSGAIVTDFPEQQRGELKKMSQVFWREWANTYGEDAKRLLELNIER